MSSASQSKNEHPAATHSQTTVAPEVAEYVRTFAANFDLALPEITTAVVVPAAAPAAASAAVPAPPPATTFREVAQTALETSIKHRVKGATGDLFRLSEFDRFRVLMFGPLNLPKPQDESVAVIYPPTNRHKPKRADVTLEGVRARIAKHMPWLNAIVSPNLIAAGGAVAELLSASNTTVPDIQDVDLFLVGQTQTECNTSVGRVASELQKAWGGKLRVFRTKNCVTFHTVSSNTMGPPVQIIMRRYATISEVIHLFDLGSSAVAYDGSDVWFTSLSKFAYMFGLNVVDLTARLASYESRIYKYFHRGFGLVFPEATLKFVKEKATRVNLHRLQFHYHRRDTADASAPVYTCYNVPQTSADVVVEGQIIQTQILPAEDNDENADPKSDYGFTMPYRHLDTLTAKNFAGALAARDDATPSYMCGWRDYTAEEVQDPAFLGARGWTSIHASVDGIEANLREYADPRQIKFEKLSALLGKECASTLIVAVLSKGIESVPWAALGASLAATLRFNGRTKIPLDFALAHFDDARRGNMTAQAWYGCHYQAKA